MAAATRRRIQNEPLRKSQIRAGGKKLTPMSATNRGSTRRDNDAYATPAWAVRRFLEEMKQGKSLARPESIRDPGAGSGILLQVARDFFPDSKLSAIEIRPECQENLSRITQDVTITDYLTASDCPFVDLTLMNPPYSLAMQFVQKALSHSTWVIALLRLNWLAAEKRYAFLRQNTPDVYILPNRPSFTMLGTDMTEYAWMAWGAHSRNGVAGKIKLLEVTPLGERRCATK
ncbi:MAG: hypothetical protein UY96_C0017G0022 [Parcubacteria group bacterium GW2011_GWB1_56_8]|nr:MAG: hypothetical protein UY96_C0017G0022 [Parcubacteria group bacterium GW2011_GWB1_56_8]